MPANPPDTRPTDPRITPGHAAQVFRADDIFVAIGVNLDDGLGAPDDVVAGDIYALDDRAHPLRLTLSPPGAGQPEVAEGSAVGRAGQPVRTLARYTLLAADGDTVDLLLLEIGGRAAERYALPLSPMTTRRDYTLIRIDTQPEFTQLADLMCISFARGTMITLAGGAQCPVEELSADVRVLTRDHGPQPIRWIGHTTLRAVGAFAPVVITAGTLGNTGDLIVSQHHRMFLYQRRRIAGLASSELLVQARYLVDDENVFVREGGFVEYFSLVFDQHEIVYAEGIPAESLIVNDATVNSLPPELSEDVRARFPGLAQVQHFGTEASRAFLDEHGPAALYPPRARRG